MLAQFSFFVPVGTDLLPYSAAAGSLLGGAQLTHACYARNFSLKVAGWIALVGYPTLFFVVLAAPVATFFVLAAGWEDTSRTGSATMRA